MYPIISHLSIYLSISLSIVHLSFIDLSSIYHWSIHLSFIVYNLSIHHAPIYHPSIHLVSMHPSIHPEHCKSEPPLVKKQKIKTENLQSFSAVTAMPLPSGGGHRVQPESDAAPWWQVQQLLLFRLLTSLFSFCSVTLARPQVTS